MFHAKMTTSEHLTFCFRLKLKLRYCWILAFAYFFFYICTKRGIGRCRNGTAQAWPIWQSRCVEYVGQIEPKHKLFEVESCWGGNKNRSGGCNVIMQVLFPAAFIVQTIRGYSDWILSSFFGKHDLCVSLDTDREKKSTPSLKNSCSVSSLLFSKQNLKLHWFS